MLSVEAALRLLCNVNVTEIAFQCGACQGCKSFLLHKGQEIVLERFLAIKSLILEQGIMGFFFIASVFNPADLENHVIHEAID